MRHPMMRSSSIIEASKIYPYDSMKETFTNQKIVQMCDRYEYVEIDVLYLVEDFSPFEQIKISFPLTTASTINCLFLHRKDKK